jgi:flagellar hook-length control protein FliK
LRDQGGQLRLRLSPPELGALRLDVSVRDGALSARLEAETPAARAVLLDNLPALRDRLAEQQIRLERFDVDLMDQPQGNPSQQSMGDRNESASRERNQSGPRTAGDSRGGEAVARRTVIVGETQLNVVI